MAEKTVADVLIDLGTQLAEIDEVRASILDKVLDDLEIIILLRLPVK